MWNQISIWKSCAQKCGRTVANAQLFVPLYIKQVRYLRYFLLNQLRFTLKKYTFIIQQLTRMYSGRNLVKAKNSLIRSDDYGLPYQSSWALAAVYNCGSWADGPRQWLRPASQSHSTPPGQRWSLRTLLSEHGICICLVFYYPTMCISCLSHSYLRLGQTTKIPAESVQTQWMFNGFHC